MRLRLRLVLYIAAAALLPLAMLGLGSLHVASRLLLAQVADLQARTASSVAAQVDTWMALHQRVLAQQVHTFDVARLDAAQTLQYLRLVYRQTPGARVVGLYDVDQRPVGGEVYLSVPVEGADPDLQDRPLASPGDLLRFHEALPAAVSAAGVRLSAPYGSPPMVAAAVPIPGAGLRLGVELSLGAMADVFGPGAEPQLALLDGSGVAVLGGAGVIDPAAFRPFLGGALAEDIRYTDGRGVAVVAACAPAPAVGWTVVVAEPVESALLPIREIQRRLTYMLLVAGALSMGLGVVFADQLALPVVRLREAARRMARGELGATVQPRGEDEVAELTLAFNEMSVQLRQDADEIARKNEEIEGFNRELQGRVEEATATLRAAQGRLLQAARREAAGELGAGLAHALNNPLGGVLGLSQLALARAADPALRGLLTALEGEAQRCRDILSQLTRLHEAGPRPPTEGSVSLPDLVHHVTNLVRGGFRERGIELVIDVDADGPGRVDLGPAAQALAALLACARAAAGPGAIVHVGRPVGEAVLTVAVEGPLGDLDDARAQGLSAWAAAQLFDGLGAAVEAVPADRPRAWRLRFPV